MHSANLYIPKLECIQNLVGDIKRNAAAQLIYPGMLCVVTGTSPVSGVNHEHSTSHEDILSQDDISHACLIIGGTM